MKRFGKFLRLVLGDFFCDAVLPTLCMILIFVAFWALLALAGWVASLLGMDPIPAPEGGKSYSMTGIMLAMGATFLGLICYGIYNLGSWLRRKWREAGQS